MVVYDDKFPQPSCRLPVRPGVAAAKRKAEKAADRAAGKAKAKPKAKAKAKAAAVPEPTEMEVDEWPTDEADGDDAVGPDPDLDGEEWDENDDD